MTYHFSVDVPLRIQSIYLSAHVNSRSVPPVSRSVGTATRVTDVKKTVAPANSSPPKKGEKTNKTSSPKQQVEPVDESDAYITVKTHKEKSY